MLFFSLPRAAFFALLLSSVLALQLPELFSRQEPGSPNYECHEDCGLVTAFWHKDGEYCDNPDFQKHLSNCLKCALTEDVWKYYGENVKNAANKCHVDATPSPSSAQGPSPATASGTGSGESSSSLTTTTGEASTSKTVCPVTHTSHLFLNLISFIGDFFFHHHIRYRKKLLLGFRIHLEDFRGKTGTTPATTGESSSAKTTAEHTSTIVTASGTPHLSTSVTASVTSHVSSSAKGTSPTTSSSASSVFNAATPIQQNAVLAALMGVLAWAFAA
ncbi:hypothetical protein N7509_000992 [Penicillium cosmopolitanum]|uniref:Extracellular membrane protein CFEM domain-containing protein n=1 Tax=Penicillium cosmopolitanum TaxID=1131564 RepID=A0A9X0BEP6_9EURO|nr:uncharacterized protein N7509_000992 [Penicillium cosmopolitanum]KAJ5414365.1 hypothetical protein N7509_000992 [Penicillium cosmopolitanum]